MPVTTDILESWIRPRKVVDRLLAQPASEPFALSLLLTFLTLALVATLPSLARQSYLEGNTPISPRVLAAAMGLLATLPVWYLAAATGTMVARLFGLKLTHYQGRIALFWAALAAIPAMLALGLVQGLVGPGTASSVLGILTGLGFLILWSLGLRRAAAVGG